MLLTIKQVLTLKRISLSGAVLFICLLRHMIKLILQTSLIYEQLDLAALGIIRANGHATW